MWEFIKTGIHGKIDWVNEYGRKGVFVSMSKPHNPEGGYKEIISDTSGYISKESKTGELRYVKIERHCQTSLSGYKTTYFDTWFVRGNQANTNIVASELTKEAAINLAYKIIDTVIVDDTICQITPIE